MLTTEVSNQAHFDSQICCTKLVFFNFLSRVLQTFFFFLLWYSFFIVAFGLGFYIMLHTDTDPSSKFGAINPDSDYYFFDSPWLALVKTSTMFVGEIDEACEPGAAFIES